MGITWRRRGPLVATGVAGARMRDCHCGSVRERAVRNLRRGNRIRRWPGGIAGDTPGETMSASSINHSPFTRSLPDFRNVGVVLRIVVIVTAACAGIVVARQATARAMLDDGVALAAFAVPVLMVALLALHVLGPRLRRLAYPAGATGVLVVAVVAAVAVHALAGGVAVAQDVGRGRMSLAALACAAACLAYFDLRGRALSPALTEARLQALQARIRPHFLFNSLNAVLSLIRADPRRAEVAIEDMAELFRVLMADNRQLVPLAREVDLCRQYLNLESLRLGDRLIVDWRIDAMPGDVLVPPLVLQPLLENAVYHGIEPRVEPGVVTIDIHARGAEVHAVLSNPFAPDGSHHAGNRMAVANIRERLALHFDAEASLSVRAADGVYEVHIVMPCRRSA